MTPSLPLQFRVCRCSHALALERGRLRKAVGTSQISFCVNRGATLSRSLLQKAQFLRSKNVSIFYLSYAQWFARHHVKAKKNTRNCPALWKFPEPFRKGFHSLIPQILIEHLQCAQRRTRNRKAHTAEGKLSSCSQATEAGRETQAISEPG